jgi:hypothetical protein
MYSINVRCLEGVDIGAPDVQHFDGRASSSGLTHPPQSAAGAEETSAPSAATTLRSCIFGTQGQ